MPKCDFNKVEIDLSRFCLINQIGLDLVFVSQDLISRFHIRAQFSRTTKSSLIPKVFERMTYIIFRLKISLADKLSKLLTRLRKIHST